MKIVTRLPVLLILTTTLATAQPSGLPTNFSDAPRPPVNAELQAALEACKSKGKPGDSAFEECMTSKGLQKPAGAPPPRQ
jgi:hypothetical protein